MANIARQQMELGEVQRKVEAALVDTLANQNHYNPVTGHTIYSKKEGDEVFFQYGFTKKADSDIQKYVAAVKESPVVNTLGQLAMKTHPTWEKIFCKQTGLRRATDDYPRFKRWVNENYPGYVITKSHIDKRSGIYIPVGAK